MEAAQAGERPCEPAVEVDWDPARPRRGIYRRLLFSKRKGLTDGEVLPALHCRATAAPSADKLAAYRRVCALPESRFLPLLYPHVLMGRAHLELVSHPAFPLRSVGLLHLRNHVIQNAPIAIDTPSMSLSCGIFRQRVVEKGLEFDIDSQVDIEGRCVWQSVSTLLKLGRFGTPAETPASSQRLTPIPDAPSRLQFHVPADAGRRYASVSGDHNPIHVSRIAARCFGFRTAIAHGMWTTARALASLALSTEQPCRLDVAFKGPVFLGSLIDIRQAGDRFDLYCDDNPRPVVNARFLSE